MPFFGFMVILNLCTINDIIHKSGALLLWISVLFLMQCKMSEYSECDARTRRLRIAEFISISEITCTSVRITELNSLHIYICCNYIKGYDEFVMGNLLNYSLSKTSLRVYNALSRQEEESSMTILFPIVCWNLFVMTFKSWGNDLCHSIDDTPSKMSGTHYMLWLEIPS